MCKGVCGHQLESNSYMKYCVLTGILIAYRYYLNELSLLIGSMLPVPSVCQYGLSISLSFLWGQSHIHIHREWISS